MRSVGRKSILLVLFCVLPACSGANGIGGTVASVSVSAEGASLSSLSAGTCTSLVLAQLDATGAPAAAITDTTYTIGGIGSGRVFSDTSCSTAASNDQIVIPAGATSANFSFEDSRAETLSFTATATGVSNSALTVSVVSGSAVSLSFITSPLSEKGCVAFSSQPVVAAVDSNGNTVSGATGTVTLAAYTNSACSNASSSLSSATASLSSGIATFSGATYASTGTIYLKATASGLSSSCTGPVSITSSGAHALSLGTLPSGGTAGSNLSSFTVTVVDACGITASGATNSVTLSAFSDDACSEAAPNGSLTGASATAVSGVATFASANFSKTPSLFIEASASGLLSSACSSEIHMSSATADHIVKISGDTQTGAKSTALPTPIKAQVLDVNGNPVIGVSVTFTVTAGGGSVSPSSAYTDLNGYASTTLTLGATTSAGGNTVSVAGTSALPAVASGSTASVTFSATGQTPAAASRLVVTGPSTLSTGLCSSALTVMTKDSNGYVVNAGGGGLSVTLGATGAATLYSDSACTTAATTVTIASAASSQVFYAKDSTAQSFTISASASSFTTGNLAIVASGWSTVDDFQFGIGYYEDPLSVAQDSRGYLYTCGWNVSTSGNYDLVVRKSTDGGNTWSTALDYRYNGNGVACNSIGTDAIGNVYLGGTAYDSSNVTHWFVMKSSDGISWAPIDYYLVDPNDTDDEVMAFAFDKSNAVYAAGYSTDSSGKAHLVVKKSKDGGQTWTLSEFWQYSGTNDTVTFVASAGGSYLGAAADPDDNIYIATVGATNSGDTQADWIVRKSADGGSTWTTVDQFQNVAQAGAAFAIAINPVSGQIYVSGSGNGATVRTSTDAGATWSTSNAYRYPPGGVTAGFGIAVDASSGAVYQTGYGYDSSNVTHWFVLRSLDNGGTWSLYDDYTGVDAGAGAVGNAVCTTSSGSVIVTGTGNETSGIQHSIIRKL